MASRSAPALPRDFERKIIQQNDRMLIESTCRCCGMVIIGSITGTLIADEAKHLEQCRADDHQQR